jgi:hypothetical protein
MSAEWPQLVDREGSAVPFHPSAGRDVADRPNRTDDLVIG